MKQFWIKLTNCTTTTGGGKNKPVRIRNNQNITLVATEELINDIGNKRFIINRYGREY